MYKYLTVLAVLAFCLVSAEQYGTKTANLEFLIKQKKIYKLLFHLSQPTIVNPELYNEGQQWNIKDNIDSYKNQDAVQEFLYLYDRGMLPRGEIFSVYYPNLLKESVALFRLFYCAKDFDIFYKTALWARININEGQFIGALYNAVIRRQDTMYIQLPPIYELLPHGFFNTEVLKKAQHVKIFGKVDTKKSAGINSYVILANYSNWYMSNEYDQEYKLNYFTEDIGLNLYYFYFRMDMPFWLKGEEYDLSKYRGAEYLYGHKQIMSRYFLERLSNDVGKVNDFDWEREFFPGYYPTLSYHNALPFTQRPAWNKFPYYKLKYIKDVKDMESRVSNLIYSGLALDTTGKFRNISSMEGLNMLGNIIEGNEDSINRDFYGSIDSFARKILGFNLDPVSPHQIMSSALENFVTSMRDPAFYRLYKRIFYYYYRYMLRQKPYSKSDLVFSDLKIESFAVDKLITYFDQFDTSINNGLLVESQEEAENMIVKVRQYRLNHKPFDFHITINSNETKKAAIRIFLGPKYSAQRRLFDLENSIKYFYEIDNWIVNLNAGLNKITRNSKDCFFVVPDPEPSDVFYNKLEKALKGSFSLTYEERLYGFPDRLLLPKGKKEGLPLQIFIYASPVTSEYQSKSRVFGSYMYDDKPCGFPLDRPASYFDYDGPNMMFKDVLVYHKDETDIQ